MEIGRILVTFGHSQDFAFVEEVAYKRNRGRRFRLRETVGQHHRGMTG